MNLRSMASIGILTGLIWSGIGCKESHQNHQERSEGHVHTAPHGGTLVELGEHTFNIEFVRESTKGILTAYFLDAHAENFVRLPDPSIEIRIQRDTQSEPYTLRAIANDRTGEKVGDTSQFEAQSDAFKVSSAMKGTIPSLSLRGRKFEGVSFLILPTNQ
jgi:hypothetical protein